MDKSRKIEIEEFPVIVSFSRRTSNVGPPKAVIETTDYNFLMEIVMNIKDYGDLVSGLSGCKGVAKRIKD